MNHWPNVRAVMPDATGDPVSLPASFALAWGLRKGTTKGPKPGLSLERIVEAGVRVAAEEGLGAVSMSRVASELGTSAMSLYRHVAAKDELVELMIDAAFGDIPAIAGEDGWRPSVERLAWWALKAYRRNPWVLQVPVNGPPITPNAIAFLEQGLRCLAGTPLVPGEKVSVILTVTNFTRVWAMLRSQLEAASPTSETLTAYAGTLRALTDPAAFPALHEVLDANVFEADEDDPDWDFKFGLARLLDGCGTLIELRFPPTGRRLLRFGPSVDDTIQSV